MLSFQDTISTQNTNLYPSIMMGDLEMPIEEDVSEKSIGEEELVEEPSEEKAIDDAKKE